MRYHPRQTSERMHRLLRDLSRQMSTQMDSVIRTAIDNHLGTDRWEIAEIRHRLKREISADAKTETLTMDGEPILVMGPVESHTEKEGHSTFLRANWGYKILNNPPTFLLTPRNK